ncbi:MAG: biotin--[acetyl-CoA-carboxylase] ligase [Pseudomonadota bacterium]
MRPVPLFCYAAVTKDAAPVCVLRTGRQCRRWGFYGSIKLISTPSNQAMTTKNQILLYLKEKKGDWVSGEYLSAEIAVTRSAVWKHICKLREEGYLIESSTKKGYLLSKAPQMLNPEEIREGLDTKVFGKRDIFYFKEIDSTNTTAIEVATQGAPEGTLVVSETQTKGRGRKGRDWFSPLQEGIYMSLILRPNISPIESSRITLLAAVTLAETLLSLTSLEITIKWPNDILVNRRKIAGILIEIRTEMDAINYMVVGLGVNVNTARFPEDLREKATSIFLETGRPFPRVRLLREFLRWFEKYYEELRRIGFESIIKKWKELSDIIGREIRVEAMDRSYMGTAQDIDNDGVLILMDNQGRFHRIFSGDVTYL